MKLETFFKEIENSNEAFALMSKPEKRVQIAKDVIVRIRLDNISAYPGDVVRIPKEIREEKAKQSLKKYLNSENVQCIACAKGALFCTFVGRVNEFLVGDANVENYVTDRIHQKLLDIFSLNQLALIETAFEGHKYLRAKVSPKELDKAYKFYNKYEDVFPSGFNLGVSTVKESANKRLIAICENIIRNKGTFKP